MNTVPGTLYGVGVGPGDPELLTLKAVRLIRECAVIAVPDSRGGGQAALDIVREHIGDRTVLSVPLPMTRDEAELAASREAAADLLCARLDAGEDVAFLTLGDPTVYSTYGYLHALVRARGYPARMVAGVPSFCAAAAALGRPLCEAGEPLHILPASYPGALDALDLDGVRVLMKSGAQIPEVLERLGEKGLLERSAMAERVGMPGQRLTHSLAGYEGEPGYFSIVIVR